MEKALSVVAQKEVLFYDDEVTAVYLSDGRVYASIRHMCQALGLDDFGQRQRIGRHEILNDGQGVCKIQTPGGEQETYVLRADLIPLWLAGIRVKSLKVELQDKVARFQKEAATILWEAFRDGRLTTNPTFSELLLNDNSPSVQAYKMAQAIMQIAQQQIILESRLDNHEQLITDNRQRIEQLEATLGDPKHQITPAQASQLSQAVKAIAIELSRKNKRNEYGGVYGELYRRFDITGYKLLPQNRFAEAMKFLTEWYRQIADGEVPF